MTDATSTSSLPRFDIFCRVVDNYGDIGVCWRLAKQLAGMPQCQGVRLWVDDLQRFADIEPGIETERARQTWQSVEVVRWTDPAPDLRPHPVVIEAFACDPPPAFVARMAQQDSLWLNLEYLSAETWIESCHALPSRQANGMVKTFFFPGFTAATGGLLREAELLERRDDWLAQPPLRWQLLESIRMPGDAVQCLQQGGRQVFLFGYPDAPVDGLLDSLQQDARPSVVIVPAGIYPLLKGRDSTHVHIHEAPFVDQTAFDHLLWSSELNFIRGEDSLIRAIWAGQPLVWQIYKQENQVHLAKLQAWLDQTPFSPAIHRLTQAWNTGQAVAFQAELRPMLEPDGCKPWQADARQWAVKLARQAGLAQSLVAFCAKQWRTG
jgi:uncharacterized repeat protein (TIGR03837 family)